MIFFDFLKQNCNNIKKQAVAKDEVKARKKSLDFSLSHLLLLVYNIGSSVYIVMEIRSLDQIKVQIGLALKGLHSRTCVDRINGIPIK